MSKRVFLMTASLTLLLCSMMALETFAQNVLAVKTVEATITKPNANQGWQETWGTGPEDLMNVNASVVGGSDLLICISATQQSETAPPRGRAFGVRILNSSDQEVSWSHVAGTIGDLNPTRSLIGSGCFHWSPPSDGSYTFRLETWHWIGSADLTWYGNRQIVVLELVPSAPAGKSSSLKEEK